MRRAVPIAALLLATSCKQEIERPIDAELLSFQVDMMSGTPGTEEEPLPFAAERTFVFDITAIGNDGLPTPFDGDVRVSMNPVGDLAETQSSVVELRDGRAQNVSVDVTGVHGHVNVWFEDAGTVDAPGSFATGLGPTLFVANPTIRNIQETDNDETSPLLGDFIQVDLAGRDAVVTAVTNDGFYMTDKSDMTWGGMFVFSHSRPGGLRRGDRITFLSGIGEEFFGFTELGFPSWKREGTSTLPPPVEILPQMLADDLTMEQYESGFVEVRNVVVCPTNDSFIFFGQWPALVDPAGDCATGEGTITVISAFTVDWFNPTENVGAQISRITGNLRFHVSAEPQWILRPRDNADMEM